MYDHEFGTEWVSLDRDAVLERAFALGVAASLGDEPAGELDRLIDEIGSAYGKSMVNLAYEEGLNKAKKYRTSNRVADDAVWEDLVETESEAENLSQSDSISTSDIPDLVTRIEALDRPNSRIDAVQFPEFLTR